MTNFKSIITLTWTLTSLCSATWTKYHLATGSVTLRPGRLALTEKQVNSGYQCAMVCSATYPSICSVAHYIPTTGACQLFYWIDVQSLNLEEENATKSEFLYIGADPKNFYIRPSTPTNEYTFSEGTSRCSGIGGRLSTNSELLSARDEGWGYCNCGWAINGRGYWIVTEGSGLCGSASLSTCANSTRFQGAHCRFT